MKIRNGFVSNSSSSSFVVSFPEKPKDVNDVKRMLFDADSKWFGNPYTHKKYSVEQVSGTVWNDLIKQRPNSFKKIVKAIGGGWFSEYDGLPGHADYDVFSVDGLNSKSTEDKIRMREIFKIMEDENYIRAYNIARRFMSNNKKTFIYTFQYADENGEYFSTLEHGFLFKRLNYIVTSYH